MNPTRSFSSFQRLLVTAACMAALAGCQTTPELTAGQAFAPADQQPLNRWAPLIEY